MNILIIGSEGFIGKHCVEKFLAKGYLVHGCDLVDYKTQSYIYTKISRLSPDFDFLFENQTYNYCINAAGNGSVPVSIEHPLTDFDANCGDVIRLLELIRTKSPKCKYLHISSAAVYGNPKSFPVYESASPYPLSPYGWHKLIAEKLCEEYSTLYEINIAVVRPFSVFGPGLRKQLFWDLYQKSKQTDDKIELWGDGTESRDFIYITDLVNAIDLILTSNTGMYEIFNLATGTETTIKGIAELFYKNLDVSTPLYFNHYSKPGDPKNWKANIDKLKNIGFTQAMEIEEGIKLTAEWIKKLN